MAGRALQVVSCLAFIAAVPGGDAAASNRLADDGVAIAGASPGSVREQVAGWTSKVRYRKGRVVVILRDSHHQPVEQARVTASFVYTPDRSMDRSFHLTSRRKGVYTAEAPLPVFGPWRIYITAMHLDRQYENVVSLYIEQGQ
jgi:nitrogen fixation protein FixH